MEEVRYSGVSSFKGARIDCSGQTDDVSRSTGLFLFSVAQHSKGAVCVWGLPSPTIITLKYLLHPPPGSSCSTFSPGSSEVSGCGWVSCHCPSHCRFTAPIPKSARQPVSLLPSPAAAESVSECVEKVKKVGTRSLNISIKWFLRRRWRICQDDSRFVSFLALVGEALGAGRFCRGSEDDCHSHCWIK